MELRRGKLLLQAVVQDLRHPPSLAILRLGELERELLELEGPMLQLAERGLLPRDVLEVEHEVLDLARDHRAKE